MESSWKLSKNIQFEPLIVYPLTLWSKIEKKTGKIAIQSFTVPRARAWAKWASERTSERSGGRERSEQSRASERVSGASERANGRASGTVLQSVFLAVIDHSASMTWIEQLFASSVVFCVYSHSMKPRGRGERGFFGNVSVLQSSVCHFNGHRISYNGCPLTNNALLHPRIQTGLTSDLWRHLFEDRRIDIPWGLICMGFAFAVIRWWLSLRSRRAASFGAFGGHFWR